MGQPVLMIATVDVRDAEQMQEYMRMAGPTLAAYGGRPVAIDDEAETLEGEWAGARTVVIEFPSAETARAWYASPEYQAAVKVRLAAATSALAIVRTLPSS